MIVALGVKIFSLFVYYYFNVMVILYRKQYKKDLSGGVNKQQEALESVQKLQELSGAPGSLRKAQHEKINKQTKYSDSEAKSRL